MLCVAGDGGFGHVWAELETARRMRLPVVLTILNNQGLGYQKDAEDVLFGAHTDAVPFRRGRPCADRPRLRLAGGAHRGPGCLSRPALEAALAAGEPTLLDVITDLAAYPPITMFEGRLPA